MGAPSRAGRPPPDASTDANEPYAYLTRVLAAEVTTHVRSIPQEVRLGRADGLPKTCAVKLDGVHLVPTASFGEYIATLRAGRIVEIKRALGHTLFWTELMGL